MLTPFVGIPQSIACTGCDCDSPDSLEEAIRKGWKDLTYDDGSGWYYLGVCPDCRKEEDKQERRYELRLLRKAKYMMDCGWRPVAIYDDEGDPLWVDPAGGRIADFSHATVIQEQRSKSNYGPENEESINTIYGRIKDNITYYIEEAVKRRKL